MRSPSSRSLALKRFLDLFIIAISSLIVIPLITIVALIVASTLGRPVIFAQKRPGKSARPFVMYKFRTMTDEVDDLGHPLPDSVRLTRIGRVLRASSLDELPEIWNVLKGEMSLVGPRPLLLEYLPLYNARQFRRHEVPPGITGWAQVNGRNELDWDNRLELDVWYVENRTVLLDLKILLLTVWKVLRREGISAKGEATMRRFTGKKGE